MNIQSKWPSISILNKLTQLSVLKVKLADKYENGTRSNAATAPDSLLFKTASEAEVGEKSEDK